MLLVGGGGGRDAGGLQVIAFNGVPSLSSALVPSGIVTVLLLSVEPTVIVAGVTPLAVGVHFASPVVLTTGGGVVVAVVVVGVVAVVVVAGGGGTAGVVKVLSVETASPTALFDFTR
jgi:hypothetical protein